MKMTELGFRARSASYANLHWKTIQNLLRFVQRGRILLRCGSAFALLLPSLGVSSLDLGRLFTQAALFSFEHYFLSVIPGWSERPDLRCAIAHRGMTQIIHARFRVRIFDAPRNDGWSGR